MRAGHVASGWGGGRCSDPLAPSHLPEGQAQEPPKPAPAPRLQGEASPVVFLLLPEVAAGSEEETQFPAWETQQRGELGGCGLEGL